MQQKKHSPQDHQQCQSQNPVSNIKCLNTKFIHSLNRPPLVQPGKQQRSAKEPIEPVGKSIQPLKNGEEISAPSMVDEEDLLFLEEFQSQESRSSSFTLTPPRQALNYTESEVINNEQNSSSSCQEDSLCEQSHAEPVRPSPPMPVIVPGTLLKKESQVRFGNGAMFRGEMHQGKMINGTFVLDSMFSYRGGILNEKFHGQGELTFHNGQRIACNWEQGRPSGHVVINYPRGQRYEGELVGFKKHGIGCLYFEDGSRYVGEFQQGEITGQGCYYSVGSEERRGFWKNGEFLGHITNGEDSMQNVEWSNSSGNVTRQQQQRGVIRIK